MDDSLTEVQGLANTLTAQAFVPVDLETYGKLRSAFTQREANECTGTGVAHCCIEGDRSPPSPVPTPISAHLLVWQSVRPAIVVDVALVVTPSILLMAKIDHGTFRP